MSFSGRDERYTTGSSIGITTVSSLLRFLLGVQILLIGSVSYASSSSSPLDSCNTTDNDDTTSNLECLSIRGGQLPSSPLSNEPSTRTDPEEVIERFLSSPPPNEKNTEKFHIQGWRWHTLSLARDSSRLEKLASDLLNSSEGEGGGSLKKAVEHVIDFNFGGLRRVEDDLFFPWLREKLTGDGLGGKGVRDAFEEVLDGIEDDRRSVAELARRVKEQSKLATEPNTPQTRRTALTDVLQSTAAMKTTLQTIYQRENLLLVPAISKLVPAKEQKNFNNRVLRSLGLFDSRVHLVGMYDAVHDDGYGDEEERRRFEECIPAVPRMMIGRWRRTLYEPQAGVLDGN